jgi:transcriptional regulator with XRE-family HTH domain
MQPKFGFACKTSRKSAGLSQESAAELLGVSVKSLSDYENGRTTVPDDIAARMVKEYDALWLGYMYLTLSNNVGQIILPRIEIMELSSSLLTLQLNMKQAQDIQYEFAEIGRTNIIKENEQPTYEKCIAAIHSLLASALAVIVAPKKPVKVIAS